MKVTDFERIAEVNPTQLGQFSCPKCVHTVNERSPEKCSTKGVREWDCPNCGRGWEETVPWARTVEDAHKACEEHNLTGPSR